MALDGSEAGEVMKRRRFLQSFAKLILAAGLPLPVLFSKQFTTSGTSIDFTVPSGTKRIKIMFDGISTFDSGTVNIREK